MKTWLPQFVLLVVVTASLGCLADLRPDSKFLPSASDEERGKVLLQKMAEAHGGLSTFRASRQEMQTQQRWAQASFKNDWPGLLSLARPWPSDVEHLQVEFELGGSDGAIMFLDGASQGAKWSHRQGASFLQPKGLVEEPVDDAKIKFWVATLGYFLQAPFRMHEAQNVYFQEQKEVDGRRYDIVFASWGGAAPHPEADQYLVWIDAETHRLARLEFTVRDMGGFVTASMDYRDYAWVSVSAGNRPAENKKEKPQLLFPFLIIGTDALGGEQTAHAIRVSSLQL